MTTFIVSVGTSMLILLPRRDMVFAATGTSLYQGLYADRYDMPEVYRRLAYELSRFWELNDRPIKWLIRAYSVASASLALQILSLAVILIDSILY